MYGISRSSFRVTGLATGFDTENIIKDLMKAERIPYGKLAQKKQLAEWRQESYRDITNLLRGVKDEFFNVLKPQSYMLSEKAFSEYIANSTNSEYVRADAAVGASLGSHTVKVLQIATADKAESFTGTDAGLTKELTGTPTNYLLFGKKFSMTLDGVKKEVELKDYSSLNEVVTDLQGKLDVAFGSGKISVSNNSGKLMFEATPASGTTSITLHKGLSLDDGLEALGFQNLDTNRISTNFSLEELSSKLSVPLTFTDDTLEFSINDTKFSFSKEKSLSDVISEINNSSTAKVNIMYDQVSDKISITSKSLGAGDNLRVSETKGNFFTAIGIDVTDPVSVTNQGVDAKAEIDGQLVTRSANTFSVNDISYTLYKKHDINNIDDTITVQQDSDKVFDNIKTLIEKYNSVIDTIDSKVSEKYDRSYAPLTEDKKEVMSEDDIKVWEKKAKVGLLSKDSLLSKVTERMRRALNDTVEGLGADLASIGITSRSYLDKGKLYINEAKLKESIKNDPDSVKSLFTKKSTTVPSYKRDLSEEERTKRYNEEGLVFRLFDIIEDNISTYRDKDGKKGLLLEKAGIEGDASDAKNSIYDEISQVDKRMLEMNRKLYNKEESYYKKYANLEKYISQMNQQSSWLMSQLGGMQQ